MVQEVQIRSELFYPKENSKILDQQLLSTL